jgi:hypothetical protein
MALVKVRKTLDLSLYLSLDLSLNLSLDLSLDLSLYYAAKLPCPTILNLYTCFGGRGHHSGKPLYPEFAWALNPYMLSFLGLKDHVQRCLQWLHASFVSPSWPGGGIRHLCVQELFLNVATLLSGCCHPCGCTRVETNPARP